MVGLIQKDKKKRKTFLEDVKSVVSGLKGPAPAPSPVLTPVFGKQDAPKKPVGDSNIEPGNIGGRQVRFIDKGNGRVLVTTPKEARGLQQTTKGQEGGLPQVTPQELDRQQVAQNLINQIGQPGELPATGQDLSQEQALKSGVAGIIPNVIGGAAAGATIGAAGGPVGVGIGAAAGLAIGFYRSYSGNLKSQIGDNISAKRVVLREADQNLREIVNYVETGGDVATALQDFNMQLALIDQAHANLYLDTQSDLNLFQGQDGTVELARFKAFNAAGGAREQYIRDMQVALLNPTGNIKQLPTLTEE